MSRSKGNALTLELVFNKTKSDNLKSIKNLNLWGNQLEDLQLIEKMPNLQVISLSVNKISSLKDFATCYKLQELYLRKNCITDLSEIRYLLKLPSLKVLWLHDNPCALIQNYRQMVIHYLPNLVKLDNNLITQQQKNNSQKSQFNLNMSNKSSQEQTYEREQPVINQKVERQPSRFSEDRRNRPFSEIHKQDRVQRQQRNVRVETRPQKSANNQERRNQPNRGNPKQSQYDSIHNQSQMNRYKNILIASLSLMKQLDIESLQIICREAQKQIQRKLEHK